jgi:hypothetical protein
MSRLDPAQTVIHLPAEIDWRRPPQAPPDSVEEAILAGSETDSGPYLVLMKWYPGYMSAPHSYRTDRLCVVVSGVWWCNSGPDFDPPSCLPVPAGSVVRRIAHTPHYDGVPGSATEPAVIVVAGIGPVEQTWIDPSQPPLRRA